MPKELWLSSFGSNVLVRSVVRRNSNEFEFSGLGGFVLFIFYLYFRELGATSVDTYWNGFGFHRP